MDSTETQRLRQAVLEIVEQAEKKCTNIILEAVRMKNQKGIELAGEATIKLREIIEVLCQPGAERNMKAPPSRAARTIKSKRKGKKSEYPKFHAKNGCLVKVGWSKKAKKEYVHQLPSSVYDDLLAIIARRVAESTDHFVAEDILQASEQLDESVPGYQVYLALAFLQNREILEKHGRRGYTARQEVEDAGRAAWQALECPTSGGENGC